MVNTDTEGAIESIHINGVSGGGGSNPVNTDTEHEGAIESVHINGVSGRGFIPR